MNPREAVALLQGERGIYVCNVTFPRIEFTKIMVAYG